MTERRRRRPTALPEPATYYDRPDRIRVSFADGHTEIYDKRVNQPRPVTFINDPRRAKK